MNPEMAAAMAAFSAAAAVSGDPVNSAALAAEFAVLAARKPVPSHPMPFDVMTAPQVAAYLQLPEAVVQEEANAGRLPGRRIAGEWRFIHIALTEWMRSGGGAPSTPTPPSWTPEVEAECEREIASIYTQRKALGTVGDAFPDEEGE